MSKRLKTQLQNAEEIRDVLRSLNIRFKFGGQRVETLLVYLPWGGGACDHSALFRVIEQSIMANFIFSCSEIEKKLSLKSDKASEELFKKAVRKISEHTAQGELGELLLFTMLEVYFEAPKILSKISLKTSRRVPVFGADAVHAQYVDGTLRLYLGESKLHKDFASASSDAAQSISSCLKKYGDEFDLLDSHMDFPEMDMDIREEMMELLDPFSKSNDKIPDILHTPCFIGFVEPSIFDNEKNYIEKYREVALKHVGAFYRKAKAEGIDIKKTALLLLPFSSLDVFVKEFIGYMGIKR
jgi:hypothetical protein